MLDCYRASCVAAVLAACAFTTAGLDAQDPKVGVELKMSKETAPPGSIAQMKVFVTEPKPITTGRADMFFDGFSEIEGIGLGLGDAAGIAVVRGTEIAISILSPTGTVGLDPDYPLLTVAGRVPFDAPLGTTMPMTMDPAGVRFTDPTGAVYPVVVKNGYLLSGGGLSVGDVTPGSADLPAGATVSIIGSGFRPNTRVRFNETALAHVQYVNPGQIDVVLAEPARMHGKQIRVRDRAGSEVKYFSYQRTSPAGGSAHPVLRDVVPIFPFGTSLEASVQLATTTVGIAVQNLEATTTSIVAELIDSAGVPVASGLIEVPTNSYVVRTVSEIFGMPYAGTGRVRLVGISPMQILGVDVDSTGAASPRLPR